MGLYRCRDRMCGALDCPTCNPGNEYEQEYYDAQDEMMERRVDERREMECNNRMEVLSEEKN